MHPLSDTLSDGQPQLRFISSKSYLLTIFIALLASIGFVANWNTSFSQLDQNQVVYLHHHELMIEL